MTVRRPRIALAVAALAALAVCVGPARSAFPGANGRIAFQSIDLCSEIHSINPDGTGQVPLTTTPSCINGEGDGEPAWSPDGSRIAFTRGQGTVSQTGFANVFVMDADGSGQTNLTNSTTSFSTQPTWSADGSKIAFVRDSASVYHDIFRMNADGSGQVPLTNTGDQLEGNPSWSPDGSRIAYDTGGTVWVMNADGSDATNLTGSNFWEDRQPSWSPGGDRIAFTSNRDGNDEIYVMAPDGSGATRLTIDVAADGFPRWSPDGTKIVFQSDRAGVLGLYVLDVVNPATPPQQVVRNQSFSSGDWQPLPGLVVTPVDPATGGTPVRVTFFDPSFGGNTTLHTSSSGPPAPAGFVVAGVYYELAATATFASAEVCFEIVPPSAPTIAHWTGVPPVLSTPATYYRDAAGTIVPAGSGEFACAVVTSFSPFALLVPAPSEDIDPPTLLLPADETVDATSPAGATVSYIATATDGANPSPSVSCNPASGSTFAIGMTTVQCTATDHVGNSSAGSFAVTVRGAKEQLARLVVEVVNASGLPPSLKTQLVAKLQSLVASFDPSNAKQKQAVCVALNVFRGAVQVLSGRGIPPALASEWVADANRIRAVLAC
jgi:hypothetical protein